MRILLTVRSDTFQAYRQFWASVVFFFLMDDCHSDWERHHASIGNHIGVSYRGDWGIHFLALAKFGRSAQVFRRPKGSDS